MQILISILAYVAAIGILVTAHEFGHFIVARRLGIKVLRFSIGFGKPIWTWHRRDDETQYVISALPLGGYVKMADEREGELAAADLPRAFNRQAIPRRFAVVLAGPVFNFLFAILAYWVIYMVGIPGIKPVVGEITPGSAAAKAGFHVQDVIVSVAGHEAHTWDAVQLDLFKAVLKGGVVEVGVRSPSGQSQMLDVIPGVTRELTEPGKLLSGLGLAEWDPPLPAIAGEVTAEGSAAASGLLIDDKIVAVGAAEVPSWQALVKIIHASPGKTLPITIERAGHRQALALHVGSVPSDSGVIGQIGVRVKAPPKGFYDDLEAEQRYNPPAALWQAFTQTADLAWLTLDASWNMLTGNVSLRNLSGPIDIAQYAGYSAESGVVPFLAFLAIVSISLGVLNLLPIPVLDGGHLLYFMVEAVKGSPLTERMEALGQRIGIVLLLMLMGFAVCNDLIRVFS